MAAITTIKLRQGTASAWTTANPTLASGEPGYETDTRKLKIGTGSTAWTALGYWDDQSAPLVHTHTASQISDSTATGRSLMTAADAAAARTAIGAGTSSLVIGTTSTTAMRGDKTFSFAEITGSLGTSQLPALAINDVFPVASQAAMLALNAQRGDIAIRTDLSESWILTTDDPTLAANWTELIASGQVISVAGKTGAVTLAKADVGLSNVDNTSDASKPVSTAQQTALNAKENSIAAGTTAQVWRGDKTWVTADKTLVGLSAVDNTSDVNKPVSTAQQTALNLKANLASPAFTGSPTFAGAATVLGLTKSMVGLSAVDNTSDIGKPISTATQTALNAKANSSHTHASADIPTLDGGTP